MLKSFIIASTLIFATSNIASTKMKAMKANLSSSTLRSLSGDVSFKKVKEGIQVSGHFSGLNPNTTHGIHVHEKGECSGPDYSSAGGHFNPNNRMHGSPDKNSSHVGDLGNLVADANGMASINKIVPHDKAKDFSKMSGKSVIIHSGADDLRSQPSGDSGDRIACGVIY